MTTPKSIQSYGGPKRNIGDVEVPEGSADADEYNELLEDAAQMTRTLRSAYFEFATLASGTVQVTDSTAKTSWGSGVGFVPAVVRTGPGVYEATYAAQLTNGLGVVESVSFTESKGRVASGTVFGHVQTTESANVITITITNMSGTPTDLTDGTLIRIDAS